MTLINQKRGLIAEPHETVPVAFAAHVENTECTRRSDFGQL